MSQEKEFARVASGNVAIGGITIVACPFTIGLIQRGRKLETVSAHADMVMGMLRPPIDMSWALPSEQLGVDESDLIDLALNPPSGSLDELTQVRLGTDRSFSLVLYLCLLGHPTFGDDDRATTLFMCRTSDEDEAAQGRWYVEFEGIPYDLYGRATGTTVVNLISARRKHL
jgi:hypothetical protein